MNEVSIVINYPLPPDLPLYIAQMNKHLNIIITEIKSKNFDKVIEHLSYYIQIGAVAHLFERANMSIILLQANVILNEIGHPGIYHRYLDLIGSALQPEEFFLFFRNYINDPENWVQ
jgi:hypothetical protein